jgi:hypothetical protein
MKSITSLKRQIMTVFSLAVVLMTIAVCAPEQALAQQRMRRPGSANPPTTTSQQLHRNRRPRPFTTDLIIDVSGYYAPNHANGPASGQRRSFPARRHR